MRIMVALSGGVDSSVVAHLLKEQGHDLVGVMMRLWTDPLAPNVRNALPSKCCSLEHIQRARSVCKKLDIPFYVLNMEEEFKEKVVDPFLKGYEEGHTPNPCIECNKNIKFGKLMQKAEELQCDAIATGHYARIAQKKASDGSTNYSLLEAADSTKDQSYYLYTLSQEKLAKIVFPLGELTKNQVFELANEYGVPIPSDYSESQDLCFYPEKDPTAFLERYITTAKPGAIKNKEGEILGTHKGLPFYTIGQRKGLGIGGLKIPLHVVSKEQKSNTIYVAPNGADLKNELIVSDLQWISFSPKDKEKVKLEARIHSLGSREKGVLTTEGTGGNYQFENGIRGIASGQYIVFYRDQEVLGGGLISV